MDWTPRRVFGPSGDRSQALFDLFGRCLGIVAARLAGWPQPLLAALSATACATKMVPSGIFARDAGRRQRTTNALHPRLSRAGDVSRAVWEVPA